MNDADNERALLLALKDLDEDDILGLCFAFGGQPSRLRLYLRALRERGGARAQFAACLVGYDLARQGDIAMQEEFVVLAPVVWEIAQDRALTDSLLGSDPYLRATWDLCRSALGAIVGDGQQSFEPAALQQSHAQVKARPAPVAELPLLSDEDFSDWPLGVDAQAMQRRFDAAVGAFLGGTPNVPAYDTERGFRLRGPRPYERIDTFLRELSSLRLYIPAARGLRVLVLLFLGAHLRTRTLFGTLSRHKQDVLREAGEAFLEDGADVPAVVGILGPMHAADDAWAKMSEALKHFVAARELFPERPIASYDPLRRLFGASIA